MNSDEIKKIIVVDDTEVVGMMVKDVLNAAGFSNVTYYNNPDAAAIEAQNCDQSPIVITDYNMPGMNGVDLLKKMENTEKPNLTGVIMTSAPKEVRNNDKNYPVIEKTPGFIQKLIDLLRNRQQSSE
jgi:two-component system, chemotaxis family, chemotaxis protein CheY